MKVKVNIVKEFEVMVTRKVKVGMILSINASMGYLDISSGKIKVVSLGTIQDINNNSYDYESFNGTDNKTPEHWVEYQYVESNDNEKDVLPLDVFIEHTMNY